MLNGMLVGPRSRFEDENRKVYVIFARCFDVPSEFGSEEIFLAVETMTEGVFVVQPSAATESGWTVVGPAVHPEIAAFLGHQNRVVPLAQRIMQCLTWHEANPMWPTDGDTQAKMAAWQSFLQIVGLQLIFIIAVVLCNLSPTVLLTVFALLNLGWIFLNTRDIPAKTPYKVGRLWGALAGAIANVFFMLLFTEVGTRLGMW